VATAARPKVPKRRTGTDCSVVAMKQGTTRPAEGQVIARWIGSTDNGSNPARLQVKFGPYWQICSSQPSSSHQARRFYTARVNPVDLVCWAPVARNQLWDGTGAGLATPIRPGGCFQDPCRRHDFIEEYGITFPGTGAETGFRAHRSESAMRRRPSTCPKPTSRRLSDR